MTTKTTKTTKNERIYTAAERADAAIICAIAASNPDLSEAYDSTCHALGIVQFDDNDDENPAVRLAFLAWQVTQRDGFPVAHPDADAEAEAMIRSGWSPS